MSGSITNNPKPATLAGKRVLITGAGGSIGSALSHAVAACGPASLVLLDASEFALYSIDRALTSPHVSMLGSVQDRGLLEELFAAHRPEIVLHTAACKHVPLLEQNPFAAFANNVLGTRTLLDVATLHNAQQFVLLSTDKAVQPRSILGASKRIAELLLLTQSNPSPTLSAVRLCNVWGSQGSVVELFKQQIAERVPLTLTDPAATRFFLPLPEAVAAILSALEARPAGVLLIPRPGPPVCIADLARDLLRTHATSLPIVVTGARPGDKLHEALLSPSEVLLPNVTEPRLQAIQSTAPSNFQLLLKQLEEATLRRDLPGLLCAVMALVHDYEPSSLILQAAAQ